MPNNAAVRPGGIYKLENALYLMVDMVETLVQNSRKKKRGRPSRLTKDNIARAALKIGVDKATIPALAAHLKVDHSSLYYYVKGRDEIISLAAEIAVKELDWRAPEATNWREELIVLTDSLWALYDSNPGLAEAFHQADVTPASGIHSFAESVSRLQGKGFTLREAVLAVDMLVDMVGECFLGWWSAAKTDADGVLRKDRIMEIWRSEADKTPELSDQINAMVDIMREGSRLWWERKRDIVLDGIALNHERSAGHTDKAQSDVTG